MIYYHSAKILAIRLQATQADTSSIVTTLADWGGAVTTTRLGPNRAFLYTSNM